MNLEYYGATTQVVDLHSKIFDKIWQNCTLASPIPEDSRPHLGKILDPPLNYVVHPIQYNSSFVSASFTRLTYRYTCFN